MTKKELIVEQFRSATHPVLDERTLEKVIKTYLEDTKYNNKQVYKHKQYTLELSSNNWILSRTVGETTRTVVLLPDELKLLDINDIQGTLPNLAYYVDFIVNRFGM